MALIGGEPSTARHAPWSDPSWEIWAHASVNRRCKRVDRWFDLHPPHVFQAKTKNGQNDWWGWLKSRPEPIYMQEKYPEVPTSVRYPVERVLTEFPRYVTSTVGWMIALAIVEGVHTIGLWGIHFQADSEYAEQRPNAEFWIGVALGRGVQVKIPEACPLLKVPADLYGYESHTPEKYAVRLETFKKEVYKKRTAGFDASKLTPLSPRAAADIVRTGVFPAHDDTLKHVLQAWANRDEATGRGEGEEDGRAAGRAGRMGHAAATA